jgi:hypothetical protein
MPAAFPANKPGETKHAVSVQLIANVEVRVEGRNTNTNRNVLTDARVFDDDATRGIYP